MPRFLTLADVAEQLQINSPAAYALVRSGELKAIQVGGRGQWRVEEKMLEQYIEVGLIPRHTGIVRVPRAASTEGHPTIRRESLQRP
jgi:excisionase family DNA binding protein